MNQSLYWVHHHHHQFQANLIQYSLYWVKAFVLQWNAKVQNTLHSSKKNLHESFLVNYKIGCTIYFNHVFPFSFY